MHSDYRPGVTASPLSYASALASELGCDEWEDNDAKATLACLQAVPYGIIMTNLDTLRLFLSFNLI